MTGNTPYEALQYLSPKAGQRDPVRFADETVAFLEVGVGLILEPRTGKTSHGAPVPAIQWPTKDAVIARFNHREGIPRSVNTASRWSQRWGTIANYHYDLAVWCLHSGQLKAHEAIAANITSVFDYSRPFWEAVYATCLTEIEVICREDTFAVQLMLAGLAPRLSVLVDLFADMYGPHIAWWERAYGGVAEAMGMTTRPDFSLRDMSNILSALTEGLAMQFRCDPARFHDDTTEVARLLATAGACIFGLGLQPRGTPPRALKDQFDATDPGT